MTRSGNVAIGPVTDRGDGTYTATITSSTTVGTQTITATEASSQLSTTAVLTQHGPAAAVGVTLSPPTIPATGIHRSTATATVSDASALSVPDEVVNFARSGGATIGATTNRGDGTYTATVTSSQTPGTQTITATATHAGVSGSTTLTQTFGALHTSGNQIVDATGSPIVLKGVHRDGLEVRTQTYEPGNSAGNYVTAYPITDAEIQHAQLWGANVVRVPLSEDFWNQSCPTTPTTGNGAYRYDTNYRAEVQQVVQWITDRGMLAVLDLHTTQTKTCDQASRNQRLPLPDKVGANDFWKSVAGTFAPNPLVAFELYNEPRVCSSQYDVGYPWGAMSCDYTKTARATQLWNQGGPVQWGSEPPYMAAGMSELNDTVQAALPAGSPPHLVFVDGNDSATDPSVFSSTANPAMFKGTDLVYAEHLYTCGGLISDPLDQGGGQKAIDCQNNPANSACSTIASIIDGYETPDVRQFPVVMDEFGWPNDSQSLYMQNIVSHLHAANRGFVAFAWDGSTPLPTTTDTWALLASNTFGPNDATASGQPVKHALAGNYPSSC